MGYESCRQILCDAGACIDFEVLRRGILLADSDLSGSLWVAVATSSLGSALLVVVVMRTNSVKLSSSGRFVIVVVVILKS